jgi:RNA polymerase sigma factor (sigma-70 family)
MPTGLNRVLRHLRQILALPDGAGTDAQLLERFRSRQDEAAFAELVRRHGPMVLGVCRRVLRHHHDAEDAFQAAFLVLARKAAVVKDEAVVSFLYAVAYRTALEARSRNARRRARESCVADLPVAHVLPAEAQDWRPILDRALQQMPEKYRRLIVLCCLEGRPRKEVARQLGLAEGTLSSRLATARQMLARQLGRYGWPLSGGALAAALAQEAPAAVPPTLMAATTRGAALVASGQAALLTTPAIVLMQGVLRAMGMTKVTFVLAMTLGALLLGAGGFVYQMAVRAAPAEPPRDAPAPDRAAAVVSEREGKLIFVGVEVKPGEAVPDRQRLEPGPSVGFLAVAAKPGEKGTFPLADDPKKLYRRWREGDVPQPGQCVVARQPLHIRRLQVGDKVERGQLVALVNPALATSDLEITVAELDANHAEYLSSVKAREATWLRYSTYSKANKEHPGSISGEEFNKAKLEYEKAVEDEKKNAANIRVAQAKLNKAAIALQMCEIRSAVAGVVTALDKKPGEMVHAGEAVLHLREP